MIKLLYWLNCVYLGWIKVRNWEQSFVLDLLFDFFVVLVILVGKVGIGKMLLVIVVGLYQVVDIYYYVCLLVMCLLIFFGKDIGYLFGMFEEKFGLWMKLIIDNIDFIIGLFFGEDVDQLKKQWQCELCNVWVDL